MLVKIQAAWKQLPSLVRITLESAALAVGVDLLQQLLGSAAPANPYLAFVVNEAKVAAPILLFALRALQDSLRKAPE